jgi:hypothetical protein
MMKEQKMNKILAGILAVSMTAGIVSAQDPVLSRNAVGYIKVQAQEGNLYLLRNDFESVDGTPMTVANVLGTQVPINTVVTLYNEENQVYLPGISRGVFGWPPAASNLLERGKAFFVRMPPAAGAEIVIMGEVPSDDESLSLVPGLNMAGFPFPVSQSFTSTVLAAVLPINSTLTTWDAENQVWRAGITKGVFGWSVAANNLVLNPGEGYFVRIPSTSSPIEFNEVKPYVWP